MSDENNYPMPFIGDPLPELEVQTTHGHMSLPGDFKGSWFVLFSHPGDFTAVCTTEFYSFQSRMDQFKELGVKLIGLSVDQVYSHIQWEEWIRDNLDMEIKFPIIADDRTIAAKLGMIHPRKGTNTVRGVFICDSKGILRQVLYYPQELGRNIDEILRSVKALQIADKEKVDIPADWPNNELIGDRLIMPAPEDEKDAHSRMTDHEGFDWWFTHKPYEK